MSLLVLVGESIKLLRKVLEDGKANKEYINSQQHEFLKVASKAVRRTLSYIRDENKRDIKTEEELSDLWAEVALAARPFDSNLAELCYVKGNYWANPNSWSDEEVKKAGIEIERIDTEIRNHFKGKARAKKSQQQKTIEKTAKFSNENLLAPTGNNQERLSEIIKASYELKGKKRCSPEFKEWYLNTEIAIQHIFGQDTRHLKDFKDIDFGEKVVPEFELIGVNIDDEYNKSFNDGLGHARAILRSFIKKINEYPDIVDNKNIKKQDIPAKKKKMWYQTNTFKGAVIALVVALLGGGIPAWFSLCNKTDDSPTASTNIFADVSKDGAILRSNNFPWEIRKSNDQDGNILYTIVDRRGDATAVSVVPDNPKYTVYQSFDGMVIKFTCSEEEISNFTIKLKY